MKRSILFSCTILILLLIGVLPAAAQGVIVPPPGVFTDPSWLKIDYHRVQVKIENQIATTNVDMQFTNQGDRLAEGTFVFPLPAGASVDKLVMYVNGEQIEAKILAADEARSIYNEIVRRLADPALLEYVGSGAIQASIFPIPPGESRRIEISYAQVMEIDNGLFHYVYPLNTAGTTARSIGQMSISVNVSGSDEISNIYSPSHNIAISRAEDDRSFKAGWEGSNVVPESDFSLYYGIASDQINLNLLTYRESANQDGFFMLLVQPPVSIAQERIVAKDVIIVLDQSGSMEGPKWDQAREAAAYVLKNLNASDRFNVILFSTGWRLYSNQMEAPDQAQGAIDWINGQFAEGGTDINGALLAALDMAHVERPTTVLFLTDGLATEGETNSQNILGNLENAARSNVRIFTFGVGDDVDTLLLDAIVRDHRGTGSYVRPSERIDEEVASLYNKISAPVLTDVALDFGGAQVELLYPDQLSDLFAGEQLTLVGRYRGEMENVSITLSGTVSGQKQTFVYSGLDFPGRAGGESFIARLWATRRIGDLLNKIRLNGENQELIDSIISLSVRYGIITPYTSFLITEDDILSGEGRGRAATAMREEAESLSNVTSGSSAVSAADTTANLQSAQAPLAPQPTLAYAGGAPGTPGEDEVDAYLDSTNPIKTVKDKTFILLDEVWTDTTFDPDSMMTEKVEFLSDAYFDLLDQIPALGDYFAVGERVIVVVDGTAYEVTSAE